MSVMWIVALWFYSACARPCRSIAYCNRSIFHLVKGPGFHVTRIAPWLIKVTAWKDSTKVEQLWPLSENFCNNNLLHGGRLETMNALVWGRKWNLRGVWRVEEKRHCCSSWLASLRLLHLSVCIISQITSTLKSWQGLWNYGVSSPDPDTSVDNRNDL